MAGLQVGHLDREELEATFLFQGVEFESVRGILHNCPLQAIRKGEVLIRRGQPNCFLYLLLSGRLSVHLEADAEPLAILERGDIVGELSVIDGQPASADVVAGEDCRLLLVEETVLWSLVEYSPVLSRNLFLVLAQRVRHGNERVLTGQRLRREYENLAVLDPATGLFNERWLETVLERDLELCRRADLTLTLMLISIDHYGRFVAVQGQKAGRDLLYGVAVVLRDGVGAGEVVARLGLSYISRSIVHSGEGEFVTLLPGTDLAAGQKLGERLRQTLASTLPGGPSAARPTISGGVAQMGGDQTPGSLREAAARALAEARKEGGNQIAGASFPR